METLNQTHIEEDFGDTLIWKTNASVYYSPKSFCLKFYCDKESLLQDLEAIWLGLMPPKNERFCWQLLHGKIAVKSNLLSKNLFNN